MINCLILFIEKRPPTLEEIITHLFPEEKITHKYKISLVKQNWSYGLFSPFGRFSGSYLRNSIYPRSFDTSKYPGEMIVTDHYYFLDLRTCESAAKQPIGYFLLFFGPWSIFFIMFMSTIFWKIFTVFLLFVFLSCIFIFDNKFGFNRSTKGIIILPRKSISKEKIEGSRLILKGELPVGYSTNLALFRVKNRANIYGLYPWWFEIGSYFDSLLSRESIQYEIDLDLI